MPEVGKGGQPVDVSLQRRHRGRPDPFAGKLHRELHHKGAGFCQIIQRDAAKMEHVADRPGDEIGIALEDEGAAARALVQADHSGDLEAAQGFADRRPADAEFCGELAFGRQLVAGTQRARGHLAADLFADFLEYSLGADRREPRL